MNKKERLISSLKIAITALKNDTIHYDWNEQQSCNCGVVSQAILGYHADELETLFEDVSDNLDADIEHTWKNGVKYLCPITGKSNIRIIDELIEAGLSREDIVHLEFMDNPAILAKSGIKTININTKVERKIVSSTKTTSIIPHPNFILRYLGATKVLNNVENIYDDVVTSDNKEIDDYYQSKSNLILYLQAWVSILESGSNIERNTLNDRNKVELEGELIVALSDENYEYATILRDKINTL